MESVTNFNIRAFGGNGSYQVCKFRIESHEFHAETFSLLYLFTYTLILPKAWKPGMD